MFNSKFQEKKVFAINLKNLKKLSLIKKRFIYLYHYIRFIVYSEWSFGSFIIISDEIKFFTFTFPFEKWKSFQENRVFLFAFYLLQVIF